MPAAAPYSSWRCSGSTGHQVGFAVAQAAGIVGLSAGTTRISIGLAVSSRFINTLLKNKGIKATIPPRKNAALWEEGHPRNEAVEALKAGELAEWKKQSGYHQRSKAETAMYRYKQLISPKLSLRNHNAQVGEMLAGVKVLNKVIGLGMPVRQALN